MKIGIMSDCHLGVSKFRKQLSNSQNMYQTINNNAYLEAINDFINEKVKIVIIAGDLFDSPNPSVQSITIALSGLAKLNEARIQTFILGGNHDYSQRDNVSGYHPFNLFSISKFKYVKCINNGYLNTNFTEKKIRKKGDVINLIDLTMLPYKSLKSEFFKEIYKGSLKEKRDKYIGKRNINICNGENEIADICSILTIHGYVDFDETSEMEDYALPLEVARNYDLIIAGHVHIPNLIETKSTTILTPGSLMPSNLSGESTQSPAIYIYDTNVKEISKKIELNSPPKIHEIVTSDINDILETIINKTNETKQFNDLYFIRYNGKIEKVDEALYKQASQNTLNLSIQTNEQLENVKIEKVSDFWSFIKQDYPNYYGEFKELLKGD